MPVYNAIYDACASSPFAIGNGSSYVMEDISFEPGPWGATYMGPRDVVQVDGMFQTAGWTGYMPGPFTTPQFYITHIYEFYEPGNFPTCPMLGNTTPIATRAVETNFSSGYAWNYTSPVFTSPVSLGTRVNVWVAVKAIDPGTGKRLADGAPGLVQPGGGGGTWIQQTAANYGTWLGRAGHPCIGDTTEDYARDQNPVGPVGSPGDFCGGSTYLVGTSAGNSNDRRRTAAGPFNGAIGPRCLSLGLRGAVINPAPAPTFDIPALEDDATGLPFAVLPGLPAVRWVRFAMNHPVTDDGARYLNIDTEGSATDLALALYDEQGNLLATDDNSGSALNAQLTFGVGRAAGVSDGAQYDGRDGQLPAGVFFLAVAPGGSSFSTGFYVVPGATDPGPHINVAYFRTNVNAGDNLPPAVPPVINHYDFTTQGPAWSFPAADTFQGTTGTANPEPLDDSSAAVLWTKFAIDVPGANARHYLDIDFGDSDQADNLAYLFDSQGALVAFSDDLSATNLLPLMSFGASLPARSGNWHGQNGQLSAGTYYLANAAYPADVLTGPNGSPPSLGVNRRWHVRGLSGMNIGFTAEFYTGSGVPCDPIDFNQDGIFPDVLDIADLLSVFSGGACSNDPQCGDIDFNNDTIFPDTEDIQALLRVFGGGTCD